MELKVLTQNLWLLPFPLSIHNKERLTKFIKVVKKIKPDIIALQEVWLNSHIEYLKNHLKTYHLTVFNNKLFNRSGLVTLSKIKPISSSVHHFNTRKLHSLIEKTVHKGFQKIILPVKNQALTLINCHLYHEITQKRTQIIKKQFKELKKLLKNKEALILGDLNMCWKTFLKLNKQFFLHGNSDDHTRTSSNYYQNVRFNRFMDTNKKEDYILFRSLKKTPVIKTKVIKTPIISDHHAVVGEIIIE